MCHYEYTCVSLYLCYFFENVEKICNIFLLFEFCLCLFCCILLYLCLFINMFFVNLFACLWIWSKCFCRGWGFSLWSYYIVVHPCPLYKILSYAPSYSWSIFINYYYWFYLMMKYWISIQQLCMLETVNITF